MEDQTVAEQEPPIAPIAWLLPAFVSFIIFANHYARDSVGALEIQMEKDIAGFSTETYHTMNSLFFVPSMIAPLLGGLCTDALGGAQRVQFFSVISATLGHVLFSFGVQFNHVPLMLFGRTIAGFFYEIVDSCPILILFPMFKPRIGLVIGMINGMLRMGSVANFVLSPVIYESEGIVVALWFSTLVAATATLFSAGILLVLRVMERREERQQQQREQQRQQEQQQVGDNDVDEVVVFDRTTPKDDDTTPVDMFVIHSTFRRSLLPMLVRLLPLHEFSRTYYMFILCGAFLYGSIVPFWFVASAWLQLTYSLPLGTADLLTMAPEGMIVLVSVPVGLVIDRFALSTTSKLRILATSCFLLPVGYMLLVWGAPTHRLIAPTATVTLWYPAAVMVFLGLAYALSNSFFWSTINDLLPPGRPRASANGLIACSLNVLPSLVPPLITSSSSGYVSTWLSPYLRDMFPLYLLAWLAVCAGMCASLCAVLSMPRAARTGHRDGHQFAPVSMDTSEHTNRSPSSGQ